MGPLISIVTVCYNAKDDIEKTMLSVLNQTYQNIEYIIIDGASNDGTQKIIQSHLPDSRIKYISEKDKGVYDAMNKGIDKASGQFINFLNAGDTFHSKNTLEVVAEKIGNPDTYADIYYGKVIRHFADIDFIESPHSLQHIEISMPCDHQSLFIATEKIKHSKFNTDYKLIADYVQLRSLYKEGCSFHYIPEVLAVRDHTKGLTHDQWDIKGIKELAKYHHRDKTIRFLLGHLYRLFKISFVNKIIPDSIIRKNNLRRFDKDIKENKIIIINKRI